MLNILCRNGFGIMRVYIIDLLYCFCFGVQVMRVYNQEKFKVIEKKELHCIACLLAC
jgi:hypothetical protein